MKHITLATALLIAPVTPVWAEPLIYGRANLSFELLEENNDTQTALQSNSSRLGVKGNHWLDERHELVYQLEYGVDFDDADTFSQRNIFLGVQSDWGRVIAGHFDTPFKAAQGKVDLFNDLRGDIARVISNRERRESNSVMYTTPTTLGPWNANFAYIASEDENKVDGKSASVAYQDNALYAAMAVNQDVEEEGAEGVRLVSVYRITDWQLGALLEYADPATGGDSHGWLLSGAYTTGAWVLKAQGGHSDIREEGGKTFSMGADYVFSKVARTFTYYTVGDADGRPTDHYLGAGVEYRF